MVQYFWKIQKMERFASEGFVATVHYIVNAIDGEYSASTYGSIDYTRVEGKTYTPCSDLTQEIVVGWVQEALGKDTVETSLQSQIDALKNPLMKYDLPWAEVAPAPESVA